MDRLQILLLGFPLFLFCSDLVNLFSPRPPPPPKPYSHHHHHQQQPSPPQQPVVHQAPTDFSAAQGSATRGSAYGSTVELKFCASCSYRGTAVTMKKMLEASFPGIDVILSNHPPTLPKRLLSKLVPVFQFGVMGMVMAGEHIFPRLGMAPPPWYFSLRANRFGAMATTWLVGNFAQSFLQSSGAFEVYCNGDLVFSKLKEQRFPSELELRQLIGGRLPDSAFGRNLDSIWS
ncbi:selT-like protein [Iris pallida]|uniref:SelT-like protein n=1 Tax=Iris pallida TaxID=29817 RepID=A0AAX6G2L8_IRIPA|nr:selT-like protein [Iris pallida]